MAYFLAKTDPDTYSLDDLKRDAKTEWDGVRNPAAVNAIKETKPGDTVIIYHTGDEKAVVGLAKVVSHHFDDWALVRMGRLSTMFAPAEFWAWLQKQGAF
jgi:predicted RNA-binding protein with PUA-like domain